MKMSNKLSIITDDSPRMKSKLCHRNHLISTILYILFSLHFIGFLIPLLWEYNYSMPIAIASYLICTLVLLLHVYNIITINPADDALTCKELNRTPEYGSKISYCHACKVDVHNTSRHCRYCDKCVVGFDHHCSWLNVCVGAKNYYFFIVTCSTLAFITTCSLALCIAYLVEFLVTKRGPLYDRYLSSSLAHGVSFDGALSVLVVSVFVLLPFVLSLYHILGFHMLLGYRGMTTYDYVVEKHRLARLELVAASKVTNASKRDSNSSIKSIDSAPKDPKEREGKEPSQSPDSMKESASASVVSY